MEPTKMNAKEARECFNMMIAEFAKRGMKDKVAEMEIAREYYCDPEFRKGMADFMWEHSKHNH